MKRLAVLISDVGKGSNLRAIIGAVNSKKINAKIVAVVSDTKRAHGLKYARKSKIPIKICANKQDLLEVLQKIRPDFIALAGWKQIILDQVIESYPDQILNLHPGLIPDSLTSNVLAPDGTQALWNKGLLTKKAIHNFLDKKSTYAGSSIHFLTKEFDFGPVLARTFVKIEKNDTVETLYARLKDNEHQIYIEALQGLTNKPLRGKTVMVVDGGGRGSVLCEKYLQSDQVGKVLAIPGNDFMKFVQGIETYPDVKTTDIKNIVKIATEQKVDLVDVAQDDAVAAGLTDALKASGFNVFGSTKKSGQIEWDKAWSRNFMEKLHLPNPKYKVCKSTGEGLAFIKNQKDSKWYIKASGLAAGKGAIFAKNNKAAQQAIKTMRKFGTSGKTYLIEECLEGEEFSAFAVVSGKKFEIIGYAQDHKTVFDNNKGGNTGGMGCSSPPQVVTDKVKFQVKVIIKKTVEGLYYLKRPYTGILYLGGMVDENQKVWIIEFNARWGDPEAQVLLPSIRNDYFKLIDKAQKGKISKIKRDDLYRVVVAATSKGYPGDYSKVLGREIVGLKKLLSEKIRIYGAGIKKSNDNWVAAGGRLLYILGEGKDVAQARKIAYNALSKIKIGHGLLHYRKDIGYHDLNRS
ncbi:MAG: phosphoribosylamine--glycine ligase [Patescibacteria group bacterium]